MFVIMSRCSFSFVSLVLLTRICICYGNSFLNISKSIAVIGQPLVFSYTTDSPITLDLSFKLDGVTKGKCLQSGGNCGAAEGRTITRHSDTVITLTVPSFGTQYEGSWTILEGASTTAMKMVTAPFATVVDKSKINFDNACPIESNNFNVNITTDCASPVVNISWVLDGETLQTIHAVITNDSTGCTVSSQVKTIAVPALNDTATGRVNVTVHMVHPSFDNEVFDKWICVAEFPVIVIGDLVWAIILSVLMGLGIAVTVACVILFVIYFKEFRYWWFVLGVEGGILLVLAFTTIGLLASETKNDSSEYVVAAVLCTLSLIVGIGVIILVVIKTITMCQNTLEPKKHEAREDPDGKTDPAHTTDGSTLLLTSTPGRSARSLPPITGNTSSTSPTGQPSRPLPPSTGNTSPTTMSASEVVPNVNSGPESGPLPPINADTEKPKKKKKKKKHLREGDNADDTQKMDLENESPVHSIQE